MNMFKKISLLFVLFLVIGIGCFALVDRDNINKDLNTKLEQTEKTYSGRIDSMTKYQEGLCAKISKLQDNVSSLQSSYNNLQETYQAYVDENELKLENLKTELAEVKASLADLQANSDIDKAKIAELQTKISNLEKSIAEKNVSIEQLNSTIETQKATIAELNKTITDLTNDLNSDLSQLTFYKNLMEGTVTEITAEDLKGVTKIRDYAFSRCKGLVSVELPNNIIEIGNYAFEDSPLTYVYVPNSVKKFGTSVFAYCVKLTSVVFQEGLSGFGLNTFNFCSNLETISIPSSVTSGSLGDIYGGSFINNLHSNNGIYTCSDGKKIVLSVPRTLTTIDLSGVYCILSKAFSYSNIESIVIPDSVMTIGLSAFMSCSKLKTVTLSNNITYIPRMAFRSCSSLTSIVIPKNVKRIDDYAFAGCSALVDMTFDGATATNWEYSLSEDFTASTVVNLTNSTSNPGYFKSTNENRFFRKIVNDTPV